MTDENHTEEYCEECHDMLESGLFTRQEMLDYHNGKRDVNSFSEPQQKVIQDIFEKYDEEE